MRLIPQLAVLLTLALGGSLLAQSSDERAGKILDSTGVKGGLIVCVGCGDADLSIALGAGSACLVQALDTDEAKVSVARERIKSKGAYGRVSADRWDGRRLPYADNLVNLLVVSAEASVPEAESLRVLVPRGVALIEGPEGRRKVVKPWPAEIDQWTHWLHGADGNAVADDSVVGPPRHLQWIEKPIWLKHHNSTINFSAMVSAEGRIFYILDESATGLFGPPETWALVARDAFNGMLLWKRKIDKWGWRAWVPTGKDSGSRFDQPADLQRQLIAVGDHVYLCLGVGAPLSRLDAMTGVVEQTYPGTEFLSEVIFHDGKLIVSVHRPAVGDEDGPLDKAVMAFDADSAKLLWKKEGLKGLAGKTNALKKYTSLYLAAGDAGLFYADAESVVCVDVDTGRELWSVPRPPRGETESNYAALYLPDICTLVVCDELLLFGQTEACDRIPWNDPVRTDLLALDAKTGGKVWQQECGNWGYGSGVDVFVTDGTVWVHAFGEYALLGIDLSTGRIEHKFPTSEAMDGSHHHRCYRNKATANYVLTARRGVEFLGLDDGDNVLNHWLRGSCRYGVMPCNGLLYVPPNPCMCYATAKVNGFLATAARREIDRPTPPGERVRRGPAFGKIENPESAAPWPTYRHDARRSGSTPDSPGENLHRAWRSDIGGRLSSVTVAGGKVFVASLDTHTVYALDEKSGTEDWQFTAGGPVDSPPTYHNGTVLFGSADGYVYCLRASDGELVWRFQAAPSELRIMAFGRLESAWPVHGSVLVEENVAYVTAGRSSFLDGGIQVYSLDPATGRPLQKRSVNAADPVTGKGTYDAALRYDMPPDHPGALRDILVSDGSLIYMRHTKIDPGNLPRDFEAEMTEQTITTFYGQKETGKVLDFGPQVTSTAGLLDDSWFNQTFWSFENASHCRLLVYDDRATYGLRAFAGNSARHARSKFTVGVSEYNLFADDRQTKKRRWSTTIPVRASAIVAGGPTLFVAGTPDQLPDDKNTPGLLWAVSAGDGKKLAEHTLDAPPVWDGMAAANKAIYFATTAGTVECWR